MPTKPVGFLSYSHIDDQLMDGLITRFRERLIRTIRLRTGEDDLELFQDSAHIELGEQWKETIHSQLESVTFLLPILTPRFFKRKECREELSLFVERERRLGRHDLILPVYLIGYAPLDDETERLNDELAAEMARRHWFDWRQLRHVSSKSPLLHRAYEELADGVLVALDRAKPKPSGGAKVPPRPRREAVPPTARPSVAPAPTEEQKPAEPPFGPGWFAQGEGSAGGAGPNLGPVAEDTTEYVDPYPFGGAQFGPFGLEDAFNGAIGPEDIVTSVLDEGWLSTGQERAVYLSLDAGRSYCLGVIPADPSCDLDLCVLDENGQVVEVDQSPDSDAYCVVTPLWTGPFCVVVRAASGSSAYQLFIAE
jgi:hypothetical protein